GGRGGLPRAARRRGGVGAAVLVGGGVVLAPARAGGVGGGGARPSAVCVLLGREAGEPAEAAEDVTECTQKVSEAAQVH
ncbi:hypothetical protein, partial [Nocardia cyriacigeorgica]|uniref:hypothetical protein n=1 Tax=Nocardia cyriacigeorgica TaxID=135487 RepID=UPI002456F5A0